MLEKIKTILTENFNPTHLEVEDDSYRHRNHAGAKEHGGGHYNVIVVSHKFEGLNSLKRHRLVNAALKGDFESNAIHALAIKAHTPDEWSQHNKPLEG
ncbi:MAG: BolA family transcriptional regulator [Magnetococcales bacterium]|nr:BolA family transcriptional regulator [Magnetococcales bacterium]|tara:strand:- start:560989 stop:561282 length:294 start_codon:yes stop_codon:yes gene_type:complete